MNETRKYEVENIDCAHCAQRIEDAVNKLDGVSCKLSFALGTMKVTSERDFKGVEKDIKKIMCGIEPDAVMRETK